MIKWEKMTMLNLHRVPWYKKHCRNRMVSFVVSDIF